MATSSTRVPGVVKRTAKDGTIRYVATVDVGRHPDGRRKQVRRTFPTIREAENFRTKTRHEVRGGVYVEASDEPLGAYLDRWLEQVRRSGVRPGSANTFGVQARRWSALWSVPLRELTPAMIQRAVLALPVGSRSAADSLAVLRRALAQAVDHGLLPRNPAERVSGPRVESAAGQPFSAAEARRVLAETQEHVYGPLWALALDSGLRFGELAALRWSDVEEGVVRVRRSLTTDERGQPVIGEQPKTAAGVRDVPLSAVGVAAIKRQRERAPGVGEALVFANQDGRLLRNDLVNQALAKVCARLGLAKRSMHDLRHTHGTLAVLAGVDAKTLSRRLGHADVGTTLRLYVHPGVEAQQEAAEKVGSVLAS